MLGVIITYRQKRAECIWNYYFRKAEIEATQLSPFWVAQINLMCKPLMATNLESSSNRARVGSDVEKPRGHHIYG